MKLLHCPLQTRLHSKRMEAEEPANSFCCNTGSLIAPNQGTFPSTTDMSVTISYKNNLTLPLGTNDFPSLHDKHTL